MSEQPNAEHINKTFKIKEENGSLYIIFEENDNFYNISDMVSAGVSSASLYSIGSTGSQGGSSGPLGSSSGSLGTSSLPASAPSSCMASGCVPTSSGASTDGSSSDASTNWSGSFSYHDASLLNTPFGPKTTVAISGAPSASSSVAKRNVVPQVESLVSEICGRSQQTTTAMPQVSMYPSSAVAGQTYVGSFPKE